jgi:hypothetical protein
MQAARMTKTIKSGKVFADMANPMIIAGNKLSNPAVGVSRSAGLVSSP